MQTTRLWRCAALLAAMIFPLVPAHAGNTAGVFGPAIYPTDRSVEYRYANALGEDGRSDNFAHRLHYQHALNDQYRLRLVAQYRDNQDDLDFDQARVELQWQFQDTRKTNGIWDSALRFDLVARDSDAPKDLGLHWTNQWRLSDRWRATAVLLSFKQFDDNPQPGWEISSRYALGYRFHTDHSIALESFISHGPINRMGDFNERQQQAGPALSGRLLGLGYKLGYLRGVSSPTPDDTVVLWLNYAL